MVAACRENLLGWSSARIRDALKWHMIGTQYDFGNDRQNWAVEKRMGDELSTYAHYFKDLGGYTLYGKRPPSNIYQVVPASRLNSLWFTNDLKELKHLGGGQDAPQYVDIAVTRADVKKLIKEAKAIDRETAQTIADKAKRSSATLPAPFLEGLLRNEWVLNFNPLLPAKQKRISFDEDGTIGAGRNGNECKWKIVDQKLEIWRANGKLQNRFSYNSD